MALKTVIPPNAEPVSLTEVKAYLRIDGAEYDDLLAPLVKAAREYCEAFQNRAYVTRTMELTIDVFPDSPLALPRPPLQSVVSIMYTDADGAETVLDSSYYVVDTVSEPGKLFLAPGKDWPDVELSVVNGVRIRFVAGYGTVYDVPESAKTAIKLYVAHRFENPDDPSIPEAVHLLLWSERVMPV